MNEQTKERLFISLSSVLTGTNSLNPDSSRQRLARLESAFGSELTQKTLLKFEEIESRGVPVIESVRNEIMMDENMGKFAKETIILWFSGRFKSLSGSTDYGADFHYVDSLIWKIIEAGKPPGVPGGPYGYWSRKPGE
jgi:hypothetical protein